MTLDEARAHMHERVVYLPARGPGAPPAVAREGVLTSVGQLWAFVRYGADLRSKATDPGQLHVLAREEGPPGESGR